MINTNVSTAISILEEEVLKKLREGPLQPATIASELGTDVFRESPTTGKKRQHNPLIRGILWGLERKGLVKQRSPRAPWELTHLDRQKAGPLPELREEGSDGYTEN